MSLNGSAIVQHKSNIEQNEDETKSLQLADLETKKDRLSTHDAGQKTNGRYRIPAFGLEPVAHYRSLPIGGPAPLASRTLFSPVTPTTWYNSFPTPF